MAARKNVTPYCVPEKYIHYYCFLFLRVPLIFLTTVILLTIETTLWVTFQINHCSNGNRTLLGNTLLLILSQIDYVYILPISHFAQSGLAGPANNPVNQVDIVRCTVYGYP